MKPTRNIVKPNTGMWTTKGKVWYQKNDDGKKVSDKDIKMMNEDSKNAAAHSLGMSRDEMDEAYADMFGYGN